MAEIINRVQDSGLIPLDLAAFKPKSEIVGMDISNHLWQGLILKEKEFRAWIKSYNWDEFKHKAVYIHCTADAIIPTWAYMLVASKLHGIAIDYLVGSKIELEKALIKQAIQNISTEELKNGKIIIKGCSDIAAPDFAMVELIKHLQTHVLSIMYGEPCSSVPIYKKIVTKVTK
jgi:hypothetical protein